jgi:hypothetical protein
VFPIEIPCINSYGVNDIETYVDEIEPIYQADPNYARVQSVSIKADITREDVGAAGRRLPVYKSAKLPIQVTSEIAVVATTDDGIQVQAFASACKGAAALQPGTIRLAICNGDPETLTREGTNGVRIYAGDQNKLTSVSFGQGGTGGSNVQATYSYQSSNRLTVVAMSDPNKNQSPAPVFQTDMDEDNYGMILTPDGWWTNRAAWVC